MNVIKSIKTPTIDKLIFLLLLLVSSGASAFTSSVYSILIFFLFILLAKYRYINFRLLVFPFFVFIIVIFIYTIGVILQFGELPSFTYFFRYFLSVIIILVLFNIYKRNFFNNLEQIIYILTFISLLFFALQLLQFQIVYSAIKSVFSLVYSDDNFYVENRRYYASLFIYTLNQNTTSLLEQRNCGFVFEPGYFSFFINGGVLLTLINTGFSNIKKIVIYILALITTFSTTGLITAFLVFTFYFVNNRKINFFWFIPVLAVFLVVFFNVSFGYQKVTDLFYNRRDVVDLQNKATQFKSYGVSMGRFTGLDYFARETWNKSPFFGLSILGWKHEDNIGVANGIAHVIRNFGFFGLILIIIGVLNTSKVFAKLYDMKFSFLFFLYVLVSLFAFPFSNLTVFWAFVLFRSSDI